MCFFNHLNFHFLHVLNSQFKTSFYIKLIKSHFLGFTQRIKKHDSFRNKIHSLLYF